jgi:hypothetical protein
MRYVIFALLGLLLVGCDGSRPAGATVSTPATDHAAAASAAQSTEDDEARKLLEQRVADAEKARAQAAAAGDAVARLAAEKSDLQARREIAEANARESQALADKLKGEASAKDRELSAAKVERDQDRLYVLAGGLIAAALVAAGLAIWLPLIRTWAVTFAVSAVATAGLAAAVAWLLPYLVFVGLGLGALGLGAAVFWWHRDATALRQVVAAVEPVKLAGTAITSAHLRQYIDEASDKVITRVRDHYHIKK